MPRFLIVEAFWPWSVHWKFLLDFSVNKCHADVQNVQKTSPPPPPPKKKKKKKKTSKAYTDMI